MVKGWIQDYQRLTPVDYPFLGDPDASARALGSLVAHRVDASERDARMRRSAEMHLETRAAWRCEAGRVRRDSGPVRPAALAAAIWEALDGAAYCLANDSSHGWARRLWDIRHRCQHLGESGGGGLGYGLGAAAGAALALRGQDMIVVDIQADGDLLYTPAALWTIAKYTLPMLVVMDNNRSYFNSQNHARTVAAYRSRPTANWGVGTMIEGPPIDFSGMARSFGVWGEGPVETAAGLPAALRRALDVVRSGRPALVDVLTAGAV